MTDDDEVTAALRRAPGFESTEPSRIERLGGMTNRVFLVEADRVEADRTGADTDRVATDGRCVVVRLPGEGTEAYIDRGVELLNARAAHRAGVAPAVIFGDAASGLMITDAVDDIVTMTPETFATRSGAPARAGEALAQLHGSGETFEFRFELFAMIEEYLRVLAGRTVSLPEGYHDVVKAAKPVGEALQSQGASGVPALAPCHCDPLCENFLDDGTRMWIVDWEYSGMNDPLWDVGDLSVEAGMSDTQDAAMLEAYFGRPPTDAERGRVVLYKAMCDLLWTLWGLIQHADGNPAEDFMAYAMTRFERCRDLMNDPAFEAYLAAVRAG